jgi:hypothetical protein
MPAALPFRQSLPAYTAAYPAVIGTLVRDTIGQQHFRFGRYVVAVPAHPSGP